MFIKGGINMDPFEDLILNDINEEYMTDLEKETIYNECIYEDLSDLS